MIEEKILKDGDFTKEDLAVLKEEGIIYANMSDATSEASIEKMINETKAFLEESGGKGKVLINITPYLGLPMRSSEFRKRMVEKAKNIIKYPGFAKAAVFGKNIVTRTSAFFIIGATGLKNIKVFDTKEKAVGWLKNHNNEKV